MRGHPGPLEQAAPVEAGVEQEDGGVLVQEQAVVESVLQHLDDVLQLLPALGVVLRHQQRPAEVKSVKGSAAYDPSVSQWVFTITEKAR